MKFSISKRIPNHRSDQAGWAPLAGHRSAGGLGTLPTHRILVTGATGNIGREVVDALGESSEQGETVVGVRSIDKAKASFTHRPKLRYRRFDFEDEGTYNAAFENIDLIFLLRPPHISAVEKVFRPLLIAAKNAGIQKVVFLSVQGAEKSSVIPHNKIERLIEELGFEWIFVRPSYFMQNLTTTLLPEILHARTITLPSGKAKFNWIDVRDIGEASAQLIFGFNQHKNKAFEITGTENLNFEEVSRVISAVTGVEVVFMSINPIRFYFHKKSEGVESGLALVMTILHFLPRLQKEPKISDCFQSLTGKAPTTLREFIDREKDILTQPPPQGRPQN